MFGHPAEMLAHHTGVTVQHATLLLLAEPPERLALVEVNLYRSKERRCTPVTQSNRSTTHWRTPSYSIRIILWGGYTEELEDGTLRTWIAGDIGLIRPALSHRVHTLLNGDSYSLFLRGPRIRPVYLRGKGWPAHLRDTTAA